MSGNARGSTPAPFVCPTCGESKTCRLCDEPMNGMNARRANEAEDYAIRLRDALRRLVERIDKVYVENLHREMLIEEQWPLLDEADAARSLLDAEKSVNTA